MVHSYKFLGHFEAIAHLHDYTLRRGLGRATCQWGLFILPRPIAILQSQRFWQHKGLAKHNTISVASAIVTCNRLTTQKRSPLAGYICQSWTPQWSTLPFSQWPEARKTAVHTVSLTHSMNTFYFTWCFSLQCLSCLVSSRFSLWPIWTHSQCTQPINSQHMLPTREYLNNCHCTCHENGELVRAAPPSNRRCL